MLESPNHLKVVTLQSVTTTGRWKRMMFHGKTSTYIWVAFFWVRVPNSFCPNWIR